MASPIARHACKPVAAARVTCVGAAAWTRFNEATWTRGTDIGSAQELTTLGTPAADWRFA
jgi:hypothetical protein